MKLVYASIAFGAFFAGVMQWHVGHFAEAVSWLMASLGWTEAWHWRSRI
jgi:hypothetical protein